ncbi:MAG: MBL fold metallo-hydrolase [Bacillota bacterium]
MLEFAWHGAASVSLRLGQVGPVVAVDPVFSRAGVYGPWYTPNPHAPAFDDYIAGFAPDVVLVTHGHFDHFDLETVKAIAAARPGCRFGGSAEVVETMRTVCGIAPERAFALESGGSYALPSLRPVGQAGGDRPVLRPLAGDHWLTGEEGSRTAAKFAGRPDRYGVIPCGGPMLGFFIDLPSQGETAILIYISGDNRLHSMPKGPVDVAVVNIAGLLTHPQTKEPTKEITGPEDTAAVIDDCLRPRTLIPVHWDHDIFLNRIEWADIAASAETASHPAKLIRAPYNRWLPVE